MAHIRVAYDIHSRTHYVMQCFRVGYRRTCHSSLVFFIYIMPIYLENLWNFSERYGNLRDFRKLRKPFKTVLKEFIQFLKILGKLGKSSESSRIFGKFFENRNGFTFSENLRKCSEIFGKFRKG